MATAGCARGGFLEIVRNGPHLCGLVDVVALQRGVATLVACGPRLARLRRFAKDAGVLRRGKKSAQHLLGDVKGI